MACRSRCGGPGAVTPGRRARKALFGRVLLSKVLLVPVAGAAGRRCCWACPRSAGPPHDRAGPGERLTRMLIAGAVCPHPPLLIPAALGAAASDPPAELRKVTEAAAQAVPRLAAARADLIPIVGCAPLGRAHRPGA